MDVKILFWLRNSVSVCDSTPNNVCTQLINAKNHCIDGDIVFILFFLILQSCCHSRIDRYEHHIIIRCVNTATAFKWNGSFRERSIWKRWERKSKRARERKKENRIAIIKSPSLMFVLWFHAMFHTQLYRHSIYIITFCVR